MGSFVKIFGQFDEFYSCSTWGDEMYIRKDHISFIRKYMDQPVVWELYVGQKYFYTKENISLLIAKIDGDDDLC